jgi:hypothetical protein
MPSMSIASHAALSAASSGAAPASSEVDPEPAAISRMRLSIPRASSAAKSSARASSPSASWGRPLPGAGTGGASTRVLVRGRPEKPG